MSSFECSYCKNRKLSEDQIVRQGKLISIKRSKCDVIEKFVKRNHQGCQHYINRAQQEV